jgi:hypothetical protein
MVGYERRGAAALVTMLSDREAAHAAVGLPLDEGLALEARLGRERVTGALKGARRFRVRP